MKTKLTIIIVALAIIATGCEQQRQTTTAKPIATESMQTLRSDDAELVGTVQRVLDGDTIQIVDDAGELHTIRLLGIDAPEKRQRFGPEATEHVKSLTAGQRVTVAWDDRDRYKRILGTVTANGVDVNADLVRRGLAWHYVKYSDDVSLARLQNEARAANVGLWQDARRVAPWDYRNGVRVETGVPMNVESIAGSDEVVFVTSSGTKFHREDCRHARNAQAMPRSRATSAYQPCRVCNP